MKDNKYWQDAIVGVLEGNRPKFEDKNLVVAPDRVRQFMEKQGLKPAPDDEELGIRDGFSTNGWDYDWWLTYERDGQEWVASGSGYYGGFVFQKGD